MSHWVKDLWIFVEVMNSSSAWFSNLWIFVLPCGGFYLSKKFVWVLRIHYKGINVGWNCTRIFDWPHCNCFILFVVQNWANDDTKLQSRNTTTTTRGGAENTYHGRSMTEIVSLVKAHYHARAFDDGVSRKRLWSLISMTVIFDPSSFASFEDGVCKNCLRLQKTILQKCHRFDILRHCQWTDVVSALLKHV